MTFIFGWDVEIIARDLGIGVFVKVEMKYAGNGAGRQGCTAGYQKEATAIL
jgi:hypothetical protein